MSITIDLTQDELQTLHGVLREMTFQARGELTPLTTAGEFQTRTGVELAEAEALHRRIAALRADLDRT